MSVPVCGEEAAHMHVVNDHEKGFEGGHQQQGAAPGRSDDPDDEFTKGEHAEHEEDPHARSQLGAAAAGTLIFVMCHATLSSIGYSAPCAPSGAGVMFT